MRLKSTVLAVAAALLPPTAAHAFDVEAWAKPVDAKVLEWRRDFHQFPELGNREFRTSKRVAEHLRLSLIHI